MVRSLGGSEMGIRGSAVGELRIRQCFGDRGCIIPVNDLDTSAGKAKVEVVDVGETLDAEPNSAQRVGAGDHAAHGPVPEKQLVSGVAGPKAR